MRASEFLRLHWDDDGQPLIEPPRFSPIIADPTFLFPEETPDGRWWLFAHSAWGLHASTSPSGTEWKDRGLVLWNAMRAFVRRVDGRYLLFYEKYLPLHVALTVLPKRPRWHSRIEVRTSLDLASWSSPRPVIAPVLPWQQSTALGASVGNPCLVDAGSAAGSARWRLYFSASLVHLRDCGFEEPRFLGLAEAACPEGPYTARREPLPLAEAPGESGRALGAGSIKVLRMEDGWIGLQNRISLDASGRSRSALWVLRSDDGAAWRDASSRPLLEPATGWRRSHVYACDVRRHPRDGRWYIYYNARDGWYKTEGRERIGRLVA
jgi:hypothetical protein